MTVPHMQIRRSRVVDAGHPATAMPCDLRRAIFAQPNLIPCASGSSAE